MTGALAHRGPDDRGAYDDPDIALGFRRLSVIDLETGQQPIRLADDRAVIVLNGEIYNYRELRRELLGRGHRFRTESDTEVVVHAYEEWGGREFAPWAAQRYAGANRFARTGGATGESGSRGTDAAPAD